HMARASGAASGGTTRGGARWLFRGARMMRRVCKIVLIASLALTPLGCRPRQDHSDYSAPASRVEHFKRRQAATELTHGRIRLESVDEDDGRRTRYQTSDCKTWLVAMTTEPNGGYP